MGFIGSSRINVLCLWVTVVVDPLIQDLTLLQVKGHDRLHPGQVSSLSHGPNTEIKDHSNLWSRNPHTD